MQDNNFLKNALNNNNISDSLSILHQKQHQKENNLQSHIIQNYTSVLKNCSSITNIKIKNEIETITRRLNVFLISVLLNYNEMDENEEMLEKINELIKLTKKLNKIFERLEIKNNLKNINENEKNIEINNEINHVKNFNEPSLKEKNIKSINFNEIQNFIDYQYVKDKIKIFKKMNFYDSLKALNNEKRKQIINNLKENCNYWLAEITNKSFEFGERLLNSKKIERNKLNLKIILDAIFIFKKLEIEDEFFIFFVSKCENIANYLKIENLVGFLYVLEKIKKIDSNFQIKEFNTNFEKEELLILLKFLNEFEIKTFSVERKLEKIAVDFIYKKQEFVNNKEDTEKFFDDVSDFLKGINQPCIYEIFYNCLDKMFMDYYEPNEIEKAIEQLNKLKMIKYKFRSSKIIIENFEESKKEIENIFNDEKYFDLHKIIINNEILNVIKESFLKKYEESEDKRKIEGEIVKFYVYLETYDKNFCKSFESVVKKCKKQSLEM